LHSCRQHSHLLWWWRACRRLLLLLYLLQLHLQLSNLVLQHSHIIRLLLLLLLQHCHIIRLLLRWGRLQWLLQSATQARKQHCSMERI
jgi:hypothetical protein